MRGESPCLRAFNARVAHWLATAVVLALAATGAHAATITVTDGGDTSVPSSCTLRQAIESANSDLDQTGISSCNQGSGADKIVFDGTLKNSMITLSHGQLEIDASVSIIGAPLTIDAGGLSRVLYIKNQGESVYLSDLRLYHGNAGSHGGGGICVSDASTCQNVPAAAGAQRTAETSRLLPTAGTQVTLEHVVVSNNAAGGYAGGIHCGNAELALYRSIVAGNDVNLDNGLYGYAGAGAILASKCPLTLVDSTIAGNTVHGTINSNNFMAGGIWLSNTSVSIAGSTISGNTAAQTGATAPNLRYIAGGVLDYNFNPTSVVLTNCTVSGNTVAFPSGTTASPTATTHAADGILVAPNDSASLRNSIAAGNGAGADLVVVSTGVVMADHSLLGTASFPAYNVNGNVFADDPKLDALANNGGPTPTRALQQGSPALNVGDPALALAPNGLDPLNYDQRGRGFPRTLSGKIDIGAFQHQTGRIFADGLEPEP